jgi:adenylate kinase family enzyme
MSQNQNTSDSIIILIVGSTGAGKTTYARKLAEQIQAVVYSIDDWMKGLYWQDMPAKANSIK